MNDAKIDECPECKGVVQRLISSGGGLLFKGTGFYATDYRSGGPSAGSKESESGSKKEKSAGKSESGSKKQNSAGKSGDGSKKE